MAGNRLLNMPAWDVQAPNVNALFAPLNAGIDKYRQGMNEQAEHGIRQEQLGLQRRAADRADQSAGMALEKQRVEQIAGLAQMADAEQDPVKRQGLWGRIIASNPKMADTLEKYGADPNDHVNGPKFVIAQVRGYVDPMKRKALEADIALKRAHEKYYDARAGAEKPSRWKIDSQNAVMIDSTTGEVRPLSRGADSSKFGMTEDGRVVYGDVRGAGDIVPPSSEARKIVHGEDGVQPGGIVVPPGMDQKAQGRFRQAMEDHQNITSVTGQKPKVGHIWARNADGTIYQKKMMELEDKSINPQVIDQSIRNLKDSFKVIVGGVDERGNLKSDGPWMLTQGLAKATGGRVSPEVSQAYKSTEHAIMNLSYALSGKTVGQAEQKRILDMYLPTVTDSPEMKAYKINAAHELFTNLASARKRGASDDQLSAMFESALAKASAAVPGRGGYGAFKDVQTPAKPQSGGGWSIRRVD